MPFIPFSGFEQDPQFPHSSSMTPSDVGVEPESITRMLVGQVSGWIRPESGEFPSIGISGDDTLEIPAGTGYIVNPETGTKSVTWSSGTLTLNQVDSSWITTIAVNSEGTVVGLPGNINPKDARTHIILGTVTHIQGFLDSVQMTPSIWGNIPYAAYDLSMAHAHHNITGGDITVNTVNTLALDISSKKEFFFGGAMNQLDTPNSIATGVRTAIIMYMCTGQSDVITVTDTLPVALYNPDGEDTVESVPLDGFTTFRLYQLGNKFICLYGQAVYNSLSECVSKVDKDSVVIPELLDNAKLLAIICTSRDTTDLSDDTTTAIILPKHTGLPDIPEDPYIPASYEIPHVSAGTGAVSTNVQAKLREWVTPEDFGAVGDGVTDDSLAVQRAINSQSRIKFGNGKSYLLGTAVTVQTNNIEIDFGNATIINNGPGFSFVFGVNSNTPQYSGLKVTGGYFKQSDPATLLNRNYIRVAGFKNFVISKCHMENVSNGGIYVEAGCENGLIDGVTIEGASGYSTNRGIWLNGSTATGYVSQLVDTSSITRNASPLPTYAVKNVRITNCSVVLPAYGIYSMNTRDTHIENCHIDTSGAGARCIAINNYSPGAVIKGNTLRNNQTATGILVTQFSHDVIIDGNTFLGSFGGGRDIYVAYLADCQIINNKFNTDSTQQIMMDMGGTAVIRGNYFNRPSGYSPSVRCLLINTIDESVAGTGTYGDTATTLPGVTFANNVVKNRLSVVNVRALTSASGNIPGLDTINVRDNIFYNFDLATNAEEYGLRLSAPGTTYTIAYSYFNNTVYPAANAGRNRAHTGGTTGVVAIRTDVQFATFRCTTVAGGGAFTGLKLSGGYFSCGGSVTLAPNKVNLALRTIAGASGAAVALPVAIVDVTGQFSRYDLTLNGTTYEIRFYDAAGAILNLTTTAVTFDVMLSGLAT